MAEEIKSVKVDNWGVFFLQKLQNFFNKTDYCDLTLQFRDNSQLKVHRLVLSACTDFFNVLEQTCDMVDDALIMPNELQADVVVPIVNFMYTGTLEFELRMYGRLLRTAKEMNMTVLLKLLEAHRRTMEGASKQQGPTSPIAIRRKGPQIITSSGKQPQQQQQRAVTTKAQVAQAQLQQRRLPLGKAQTHVITRQIGATSVTSTTANKEADNFEQLRRGYNNNKRPSSNMLVAPVVKKPNIEDVKEFSEQQRMRKQISAEFGEDPEYDSILDDDIHADDDDEDNAAAAAAANPNVSGEAKQQGQRQKQQQLMQTHEQATITIKQGIGDQPATIIVKDASNTKMNHERIIQEVLRQYPHLVKGNKNIKLKIMPNAGQQKTVKKIDNPVGAGAGATAATSAAATPSSANANISNTTATANDSNTSSVETSSKNKAPSTTAPATPQKRRIDSKTMHTLIAMGAENMEGPWLCLRCGINGRPISIPSYRSFRRHLVNTHKETIDAALCEHCGWRSSSDRELHFHNEQEHNIKSTQYTFPVCPICSVELLDSNTLAHHMQDNHENEEKQQCIYCNRIFGQELQLYQHMKSYHKKQAIEDGIIDYEDEEFLVESLMQKEGDPEAKVKILSDISLPVNEKMDSSPSSEAAGLSTVASGIAASIGVNCDTSTRSFDESFENGKVEETKFINADGNEMVLTEEQRKEIMAQLNQENVGGTVMVLQDDEKAAAMETGEEDDSQIYKELSAAGENQVGEEVEEDTNKTSTEIKEEPIKQDINEKLKELTGDWSDEDEDFTEMPQSTTNTETQAENVPKNKEKEEAEDEEEEEAATSVVEEDDIDLALKNLHTDTALDVHDVPTTEQSHEKPDTSKDETSGEADAEENVEMADETKAHTVDTQVADTTQLANDEVETANESNLEHNTSLTEEEEFVMRKSGEEDDNLEDELDDKEEEENTLLDDLLADAKAVVTLPEAQIKNEKHEDEKQNTSSENVLIKEEKDAETPSVETDKEAEAEKEIDDSKKNIKLFAVEEKTAASVEEIKTPQTVKSLISEWDDADDDDEDDDAGDGTQAERTSGMNWIMLGARTSRTSGKY